MNNDSEAEGSTYAGFILELYLRVSNQGEELRCNGATENYDTNKYKAYIVGLMTLWRELAPKMKDRKMKKYEWLGKKDTDKDFGGKEPGFFYFEKYENDESKLVEIKDDATRLEELTKLGRTIRFTLEELDITRW